MKKIVHKADTRGRSLYDWLDSHHTFSFDHYYDADRVNFGVLRVLNDDRVEAGEGFGTHPHKNMEIVSIPIKGALQHGDSHNNSKVVRPGEIQTMSAGSGIHHSEMNHSKTEPVEFLQIWILPRKYNTTPVYKDYNIRRLLKKNELATIVAPDGTAPASLLQDTWFSMGTVEPGKTITYEMHEPGNGVYLFLIEGEVEVEGTDLSRRDGMGIYDTDAFHIHTTEESHILLIEVPMSI